MRRSSAYALRGTLPLLDHVLGRPLATSEERAEQIGPAKGLPVFGLDALGSAAYGPEAALTLLMPLGLARLKFILPLSISIMCYCLLCTSRIGKR
jgi:hypothetical protein